MATHLDRFVSDQVDEVYAKGGVMPQPKAHLARVLAQVCIRKHDALLGDARIKMSDADMLLFDGKLTKADKALLDARRCVQAAKTQQSMGNAFLRYANARDAEAAEASKRAMAADTQHTIQDQMDR